MSSIALWLAVRDVAFTILWDTIRASDIGLLAIALAVYLTNVAMRALRWHTLLRPVANRPLRAAQALIVGLALNNILPARLGELFRIEYTYRRVGASRGYCTGCLLRERLFDLASLGAILGLAIALGALAVEGQDLDRMKSIIAGFLVLFLVVSALAVAILIWSSLIDASTDPARSQDGNPTRIRKLLFRIREEAAHAAAALRGVGAQQLLQLGGLSILVWGLEAFTLFLVVLSLDVTLTVTTVALLLFVASLSTLLPSAPGYIGTYQLAFVIALSFDGISSAVAVAAATIQQVVNIGFVTGLGLLIFLIARLVAPHPKMPASDGAEERKSP